MTNSSENRPQRIMLKSSPKKTPSRLVLRATAKKPLEERASSGNTPAAYRPSRSSPVTIYSCPPRRTRLSILLDNYRDSATPHHSRGGLESTNQSAISSAGKTRNDTVKSVKWDPSIVVFGPASSKTLPGTEKIVKSLQAITESVSMITKQADELEDYVNTVVGWSKPERQKIQKLLDALRELDSEVGKPVSENASSKPKATSTNASSKPLNPCAPVFRDFTTVRSQVSKQKSCLLQELSTLTIPRRRPRTPLDDPHCDLQSPIRTRTSIPHPIRTPVTQQFSMNPLGSFIPNAAKLQLHAEPTGQVGLPAIPSEDEHGRVAQAIDPDWANSILEKFIAKYPLTGKLKAGPRATPQGRHAAMLQQSIEFLLMKEKEKKAFAEMSVKEY